MIFGMTNIYSSGNIAPLILCGIKWAPKNSVFRVRRSQRQNHFCWGWPYSIKSKIINFNLGITGPNSINSEVLWWTFTSSTSL